MALALGIISPQAATLWPALLCCTLLLLTSRAAGREMSLTWSWEQEAHTFTRRLMAISSCPDAGEQVRLGQCIQLSSQLQAAGWAAKPKRHIRRDTPALGSTQSIIMPRLQLWQQAAPDNRHLPCRLSPVRLPGRGGCHSERPAQHAPQQMLFRVHPQHGQCVPRALQPHHACPCRVQPQLNSAA